MEKYEKEPLKGLMEKVKKDLGLTEALPQEVLDAMKEEFANEGKEKGEPTEEVLETCLAEMAKLKETKLKGILVLTMLGHLPLADQVAIIECQKEVVSQTFLAKNVQNGLGGILLAAAIAKRLKDEQ